MPSKLDYLSKYTLGDKDDEKRDRKHKKKKKKKKHKKEIPVTNVVDEDEFPDRENSDSDDGLPMGGDDDDEGPLVVKEERWNDDEETTTTTRGVWGKVGANTEEANDTHESPTRRQRYDSSSEEEPGAKRRHDSDSEDDDAKKSHSPPPRRRQRHDSSGDERQEQDPKVSRRRRHDSEDDSDSASNRRKNRRRRRYDSDDSNSNEKDARSSKRYDLDDSDNNDRKNKRRRQRHDSDDESDNDSDHHNRRRRHDSDSEDDNDSDGKPRMSSGHKAGLQHYRDFNQSEQQIQAKKHKDAQAMVDKYGMGDTVYRDKDGKKTDVAPENQLRVDTKAETQEKLNQGVVQQQARAAMAEEMAILQSSEFARRRDDERLEAIRKNEIRADDPMAKYAMKKQQKHSVSNGSAAAVPSKPVYKGPPPKPNRFGIRPGYRWDGNDRGNGFEDKLLAKKFSKTIKAEQAYRYSSADM